MGKIIKDWEKENKMIVFILSFSFFFFLNSLVIKKIIINFNLVFCCLKSDTVCVLEKCFS